MVFIDWIKFIQTCKNLSSRKTFLLMNFINHWIECLPFKKWSLKTLYSFLSSICNATFMVPALIAGFSMSNPDSLSWAIEMWGYSILGLAMLFLVPYYKKHPNIRLLIFINFVLSFFAVLSVCFDNSWLLVKTGLILFFFWNCIMILILIGIYYTNPKRGWM